jgi:hypothetical protein
MMKKLDNIPEKNPFKVPDKYFEEVSKKILSATSGREHDVRKVSAFNRFRTHLLIAASIACFVLLSYTAIRLFAPGKVNSQVSEALKDINPESYINDIDISALEEGASSIIFYEEGPDVSKKDIIDYLLKENIEINEIYEQL